MSQSNPTLTEQKVNELVDKACEQLKLPAWIKQEFVEYFDDQSSVFSMK